MSEQELVFIPPETALVVFTEQGKLDPYLAKIRAEIDKFIPDISTKKGRDECASMAYKVAKSKTYLEGVSKLLADKQKEIPKLIDASRKTLRDTLDAWRDEVRKPLTDWEDAEAARVAQHQANLSCLEAAPVDGLTSDQIQALVICIESNAIGPEWEEFETDAHRIKTATVALYQKALAARQKYEAEQAELARLRVEAEERARLDREEAIRKEAVANAIAQAEAVAQRERELVAKREADAKAAAERRELELQLQAERAEKEKLEAEQRAANAAKEAEMRLRLEAEDKAAKEAAELAVREADKKHKAAINRAAAAALVKGGLTDEQAKAAVTMIAKGEVPNIKISY